MNTESLPGHRLWTGALLAVLAGCGLLFLDLFEIDQTLVFASYNLPFRWRSTLKPREVIIVGMDEASHLELGQPRFGRWDRTLHARLLRRLADAGTGPVIFDLLFLEPDAGDGELADAIREYPTNVILASSLRHVGPPARQLRARARFFEPDRPQEPLLSAAGRPGSTALPYGFSEVSPDRDGVVREFWPFEVSPEGAEIPRLAFSAFQAVRPAEAGRVLDRYRQVGRNLGLNYYGPPTNAFQHIPYHEMLTVTALDQFREKIILVGASPILGYTGAGKDTFFHPYHRDFFLPGIELHATILTNLLRGEWLTRQPLLTELGILALTGTLLGCGLPRLRALTASLVAVGMVVGVTVAAVLTVWQLHAWFPWLIIVAVQIPVALLWGFTLRNVRAHVEMQRLRHSFGVYASDKLAAEVGRNPALLQLGSQPREVSVLFSDIVSFSRIGERLDPQDYQRILQGYYSVALNCIFEKDGMVMNIVGDSIFAVWNTPISPQNDHARLACETAVMLQQRMEEFNRRHDAPPLTTRIGLHCGKVNVGNFGTPTRMVYTAIGEATNLASRLEGLNKYLGTRTLASRAIQKSVDTTLPSRRVGYFRFQGFDRPAEIFELLMPGSERSETPEWMTAFADGLRHFRLREFDQAEKQFARALTLRPDDGVAKFYLEEEIPKCRLNQHHDTDADFGVVIVPGK